MYYYKLENEVIYVPIHLNEIGLSRVPNLKIDKVSSKFTDELSQFIASTDLKGLIVLDFSRIQFLESRCFKKIKNDLAILDIAYINIRSTILTRLENDELEMKLVKCELGKSKNSCYFAIKSPHYCDLIKNLSNTYIKSQVIKLLAKKIFELRSDVEQELESSRITSNMYVNIKPLSMYPEYFKIAIYYLSIELEKVLQDKDVTLISSSHNGAILCDALEDYLEMKSYHFINLGPQLCLHNRDIMQALSDKENYFLIYDFICLGTELKTTEAVLNAYGKKLIGGLGIANLLSLEDKKVFPLFYVNQQGFNYRVELEKKNETS